MRIARTVFFSASVWELLRFGGIFFFILYLQDPWADTILLTQILWLGSSSLGLSAGFFFLGLDSAKYRPYLTLLIIGKLLSVVSGIIITILSVRLPAYLVLLPTLFPLSNIVIPAGICLIDLIFLAFLLSFTSFDFSTDQKEPNNHTSEKLPELTIHDVEED